MLLCFSFQYYFTVLFGHEGQKPLELRCEEEQDGKEWMEAIHQARYGCKSSVWPWIVLVLHWGFPIGSSFGQTCKSEMGFPFAPPP